MNFRIKIINLAIKIHSNLGPGLLESTYEECMFYEINKAGIFVEKQKPLPLIYEEVKLEVGYRLDLFVEKKLVLENKSVESLCDVLLRSGINIFKIIRLQIGASDEFQC